MHTSWSNFIHTHPDTARLSANPSDVVNALNPSPLPIEETDKLVRLTSLQSTPSSIILTLNPFDMKVVASFSHEPFGITLQNNEGPLRCIALTGFGAHAVPIFLDTDKLLSMTQEEIPVPCLPDFLDLHDSSLDDLKALRAEDTGFTSHVNLAAVLPPQLYGIVTDDDAEPDCPWYLLHQVIKHGQSLVAAGDPGDHSDPALHLFPLMLTLWAFANHQFDEIPHMHTANTGATDSKAIKWSAEKHASHISQHSPPQDHNNNPHSFSALDRLAASIEASNDARIAATISTATTTSNRTNNSDNDENTLNETNSDDESMKTWKKINEIFRQGILFANSEDGETVPEKPSKEMLQLVNCKNGAIAARLLSRWFPKLDISVQIGMALNISRGMVWSHPDPSAIDTLSPFFCPPAKAGFNTISNEELNSLELSSRSFNLTAGDIKKMTKCSPYIPFGEQDTFSLINNFHAVVSIPFGKNSIAVSNINTLIKHYESNKIKYQRCFDQNKYFGLWLVDRVHFNFQSLLHSCFQADNIADVDFHKYNFKYEINEIDNMTFKAEPPSWYKPPSPPTPSSPPTLTDSPSRAQQSSPKRSKVENPIMDPQTSLQPDEKYSQLVHYRNLEKCKPQAVRMHDSFICNNWHIRGHCFSGCKRAATHNPLSSEIKSEYRKYVSALRQCQADYRSNTQTNSRANQGGSARPRRSQGEE